MGTFGRLWNGLRSVPACRRNCSFATACKRTCRLTGSFHSNPRKYHVHAEQSCGCAQCVGAQRVSDRMSRFPPSLQPFAVNNGLDDPNHKLKRHKYQIPVERHANPHAGRRYDREQQLCADVDDEEQLCVAPVPEAERQQQDSLY